MRLLTTRRIFIAASAAALLAACSPQPTRSADETPPIVFVHGDGDSASSWLTTVWRFESQGWPRERLHAIDLPYPLAHDDDTQAQEGRSSTTEYRDFLAAEVARVLRATGAAKVVLMANSRGGNAVRNYIANGGAASHAVLGGVPNHGIWADAALRPNSEFNGVAPFLRRLNAPQGAQGDEVMPGTRWLTIRSDNNDKYAQPDGVWIGTPGKPTNVGYDGPALKGAENVVIAGIDHRETAFSAAAFAAAYDFITGRAPAHPDIVREATVRLDGTLSGLGLGNQPGKGNYVNNLPLIGATLEVYATDSATGERRGAPLLRKTIGADGRWGPLTTDSQTALEFVIGAAGFSTTHIYRSPFARSSSLVNLRAERLGDADKDAAAVLTMSRPRGYFGLPRDRVSLDGISPPAGIPSGVAGVSSVKLKVPAPAGRAVVGEFNGERIVGRAWPADQNHIVILEMSY